MEASMSVSIPRRALLGLGPVTLASCARREREPYFGKSTPPRSQTLIYNLGAEPATLDPAITVGGMEAFVFPALFEPLLSRHPESMEPAAGLATHYEMDAGRTEITFYLRGHRCPAGSRFFGAPAKSEPPLWSDGRPVTADDLVCNWQRIIDPVNGNSNAAYLYPLANGREINQGKAKPETLGAVADGPHTLRVTLKAPAAHFFQIATSESMAPVPRHAVERHGKYWIRPGLMPSCGPFLLHEWKPYERMVLRKNPRYHDASRVHLDEIRFLPIVDGATGMNLYKADHVYAMHGRAVPPLWIPTLRGRKDFSSTPAYRSLFYAFNTTKPPFDNVLVRYAFQMATDTHAVTRFLEGGQTPARTVIPLLGAYPGVRSLLVKAGGRVWDVLSHDPPAARELLRMAKAEGLSVDLTFPDRPRSKEMAEILQAQWRANLGVRVHLIMVERNVWDQMATSVSYRGIIESGTGADYADPQGIFDLFTSQTDGSGWVDTGFDQLLDAANAEPDNAVRMRKLLACEERLLRAMPVLPLFFDSYCYLEKPFVGGMTKNVLGVPQFKTAWIDTNWRPQ
jgi:ABC-type oligopeptide transport system substrate-binding subunit